MMFLGTVICSFIESPEGIIWVYNPGALLNSVRYCKHARGKVMPFSSHLINVPVQEIDLLEQNKGTNKNQKL